MGYQKQKVTEASRKRLGYAIRAVRMRRNATLAEMAEGHGFTGSALSAWEQGKYLMERPSRVKLDKAMGWPEGTTQLFLDGKYKSLEDIGGPNAGERRKPYIPDIPPEEDFSPEYGEPLDNSPLSPEAHQVIKPDDPDAARKALALLLNQAMESPNPDMSPFTIEILMPCYWDGDRARRVAEAARKLAQQAVDAYVAQNL